MSDTVGEDLDKTAETIGVPATRNWKLRGLFILLALAMPGLLFCEYAHANTLPPEPPLNTMPSMAFVCESPIYWKDKGERIVKIDTAQGTLSVTDQQGKQEIEPITDYRITYAEYVNQFGHHGSKLIILAVDTQHHNMRANPGRFVGDPYIISYERGSKFSNRAALSDDCNQISGDRVMDFLENAGH